MDKEHNARGDDIPQTGWEELYDNALCAYVTLDLAGHITQCNKTFLRWTGYEPNAVLGMRFEGLLPRMQQVFFELNCATSLRLGGSIREVILEITAQSGQLLPVMLSATAVLSSAGSVVGSRLMLVDVRERKKYEQELLAARRNAENSEAQLRAVLNASLAGVVVLGEDWRITFMNQQAANYLPTGENLVGTDVRKLMTRGSLIKSLEEAKTSLSPVEVEWASVDASRYFTVQAINTQAGLIVFFQDISEQKAAQEQIEYQATHDSLTGLLNRQAFYKELRNGLETGESISLLLLDLDGFKQINDTHGHQSGDVLLQKIAELLQGVVNYPDITARLGGDEFAVLVRSGEAPQKLADQLLRSFRQPILIGGRTVHIGGCIGIAELLDDTRDMEDLFAKADLALYSAKAAGDGVVRHFTPALQLASLTREALKRDLARALDSGELYLDYQPQYDLRSRRVTGFEALLRWSHPTRGLISPVEFIPLAEESGMINEIGEWVLEQACHEASHWPDDVSISVNLSPVQFRNMALPLQIVRAISDNHLAPARLVVEITESILLRGSAENLKLLNSIKRLGVRVALDDFGVGYSSLSYLRTFGFDKIKIDRSFVTGIEDSAASQAIVEAISGLGHKLGARIVAEGIELKEQEGLLQKLGCDIGQGYLFSRPVGAVKAREMLFGSSEAMHSTGPGTRGRKLSGQGN